MPRRLPPGWSRVEKSAAKDADFKDVTPETPRNQRVLESSVSPQSPRVAARPSVIFMRPGIDKDDRYCMVEDELFEVAKKYTAHLHAAEYRRLKEKVRTAGKDRGKDKEVGLRSWEIGRLLDTSAPGGRRRKGWDDLEEEGNDEGGFMERMPKVESSLTRLMNGEATKGGLDFLRMMGERDGGQEAVVETPRASGSAVKTETMPHWTRRNQEAGISDTETADEPLPDDDDDLSIINTPAPSSIPLPPIKTTPSRGSAARIHSTPVSTPAASQSQEACSTIVGSGSDSDDLFTTMRNRRKAKILKRKPLDGLKRERSDDGEVGPPKTRVRTEDVSVFPTFL